MTRLSRIAGRRGFTLIEILVATAISVILVLGVVRIATYSLQAYENATALASATATARTVLDTLETDIQGAILREDGNAWLQCLPSSDTGGTSRLADKTNLAKGADMQLQLFGTPTDRDRVKPGKSRNGGEYKGDVCAIRYRIMLRNALPESLQPDSGVDRSFCLVRTVVNSEDPCNGIIPSTQSGDAKGLNANYWKSGPTGNPASDKFPADQRTLTPAAYSPADLLATNVIGLTPIFIFRATDTSGTSPLQYFYYMAPESDASPNPAEWLNPANASGDTLAYCAPDKAKTKPSALNTFKSDLKIAASWCAADAADTTNTTLAAAASGQNNKYAGQLTAVVLSLVVLDDSGAAKVRQLLESPKYIGKSQLDAEDWDKIYAEHAHFFTRRVNLHGR